MNTDDIHEKIKAELERRHYGENLWDAIQKIIKDKQPEQVIEALTHIALEKHFRLRELQVKYSQAALLLIELLKDDQRVNGMPGYKVDY